MNGAPNLEVKRVYYIGTDQLVPGYNLCYDQDATTDNASPELRLGSAVEKPATANLNAYAGVVVNRPSGIGPCFVDIAVPRKGDMVVALCNANATAFATALAPQDASYALAAHSDSGLNLPMVARAAVTANTSVTAANKTIQF
jgi:hypothetical protein